MDERESRQRIASNDKSQCKVLIENSLVDRLGERQRRTGKYACWESSLDMDIDKSIDDDGTPVPHSDKIHVCRENQGDEAREHENFVGYRCTRLDSFQRPIQKESMLIKPRVRSAAILLTTGHGGVLRSQNDDECRVVVAKFECSQRIPRSMLISQATPVSDVTCFVFFCFPSLL